MYRSSQHPMLHRLLSSLRLQSLGLLSRLAIRPGLWTRPSHGRIVSDARCCVSDSCPKRKY